MDATIWGPVLACVGVLAGAVVAFIGKRGENNLGRFNSFTDQLQEELTRTKAELAEAQRELVDLHKQRNEDLVIIARLQIKVIQLGGEP